MGSVVVVCDVVIWVSVMLYEVGISWVGGRVLVGVCFWRSVVGRVCVGLWFLYVRVISSGIFCLLGDVGGGWVGDCVF